MSNLLLVFERYLLQKVLNAYGYSYVWLGYQWLCMVIQVSMVMCGYQWLCMVINGYVWLSMVICGYIWLCVVINGYVWLCWLYRFHGYCGYVWLCVVINGYLWRHLHVCTTSLYLYTTHNNDYETIKIIALLQLIQ